MISARVAVLTLVASGCLGAGIYWATKHAPAKPKTATREAAPAEEPALHREEKLDAPRSFERAPQTAPAPDAKAAANRREGAAASPAAPAEKRQGRVEGTFDSEAVDPSWARTTSNALRDGLRNVNLPGLDVSSVECRRTVCKVSARYEAPNQPRALFTAACIGPESQWAGLHMGCYLAPPKANEDGSGELALYAMRGKSDS